MTVDIEIPSAGESVSDIEIREWRKSEGDAVERDETLAVLDTDKASMELPSPADGTLVEISKRAGETVSIGTVIGRIEESGQRGAGAQEEVEGQSGDSRSGGRSGDEPGEAAESGGDGRAEKPRERESAEEESAPPRKRSERAGRAAAAHGESEETSASTTGGAERAAQEEGAERDAEEPEETGEPEKADGGAREEAEPEGKEADVDVVPMSLLRRGIAKRLVEAQREAALLSTFNEIDVSELQALRERWREAFEERHGVSLGLLPLFVKAAIEALKDFPELNAEVRGDDIVYHRRYDIGIAVSSSRGLVVPVLRSADRLGLAALERRIEDFAQRAEHDELELEEIRGGTFTITNGGVFGSLLSTPIVNPPQSGILGLHAVQDRPVAVEGEVRIRPMMYVALTYDHRLVDGREAIGFLRRVAEIVEAPERLLLEA